MDESSGTLNITATFDIFGTSNGTNGTNEISDESLEAISSAITEASEELDFIVEEESLNITGNNNRTNQ